MRYLRILFLSTLFLSGLGWANSSLNTKDPGQMVEYLTTETLNKLKQNPELLSGEDGELQHLIEQELLPHINYVYAAYKVVGSPINRASKTQRANFADAFKDYMIGTFTLLFSQYDPERHVLKFDPVRIKGQVPAHFEIPGKPDISLIFYLRESRKTKDWKVYDLAVEGISQVETKHREFKPLIRQRGIDYVTSKLKEKVNQGLSHDELSGLPGNQSAK